MFKVMFHNQVVWKCLSLRSKRFQSSYCAKVRAEVIKKRWKGKGEGKGETFPSPPSSFLFLLFSQVSRRTRAETLATQARNVFVPHNKGYYKVKTLIPNITQSSVNVLIKEPMNSSNYFINIQFIKYI